MSILLVLLGLVVLIALGIVGLYNSFVKLRIKVEEAWADIDTQLKRRYDLIPNIVETVKGYAKHESETFENVVKARNAAMNQTGDAAQQAEAENMLTGALKSIFALAESYPELKANENFKELQDTLREVEEHIQLSRRYYNGSVRDFNTAIAVFPGNIIAGMFNFTKREFFEIDEAERENVKVDFN